MFDGIPEPTDAAIKSPYVGCTIIFDDDPDIHLRIEKAIRCPEEDGSPVLDCVRSAANVSKFRMLLRETLLFDINGKPI